MAWFSLGRSRRPSPLSRRESIALVSHNLLTPLGRIRYAAEALLGEIAQLPSGPRQTAEELANRILADAQGLLRGTVLLLEYSDLLEEEKSYSVRATDTSQVIKSVIDRFRPLMRAKDLEFAVALPEEKLPRVSMNELYLHTILEVLLDNALKYTPMGGRVTFSIVLEAARLRFVVTDTGVGLSSETLKILFDPPRALHTVATIKDSGMGLGLVVSKRLIEHHGGSLKASSPGTGQGSTFTFTLPLG